MKFDIAHIQYIYVAPDTRSTDDIAKIIDALESKESICAKNWKSLCTT